MYSVTFGRAPVCPFYDSVVLEMAETRNEQRSRNTGQTPLEFVEVAAADQ
jgi:hypothetical protein